MRKKSVSVVIMRLPTIEQLLKECNAASRGSHACEIWAMAELKKLKRRATSAQTNNTMQKKKDVDFKKTIQSATYRRLINMLTKNHLTERQKHLVIKAMERLRQQP